MIWEACLQTHKCITLNVISFHSPPPDNGSKLSEVHFKIKHFFNTFLIFVNIGSRNKVQTEDILTLKRLREKVPKKAFFFNSGFVRLLALRPLLAYVPASGDTEDDCGEADGM
jgi:hypothetical protein